jgi:hypothetical protein
MIPYVEVIEKYSLKSFALIEPSECWFEISYFDLGQFEIYTFANSNNLAALKNGNYIKIPNKPYLWIIKSVQYTYNAEGARMIDVKGYEAKWLLNQRIVLAPVQLSTDLATAVYELVIKNLGNRALAPRIINGFNVIRPTFNITIEQTQASRGNLWDLVQELLKSNGCGCFTTFENGQITFRAIQGTDKSNSIVFSQSMDNLISSDYYLNSENYKTYCRVVSTFSEENEDGESVDVDYVQDYNKGGQNIDRYEMLLESNLSTKYIDDNGEEQEVSPSSSLYQSWQQQEGKNTLADKIIDKEFNGEIDIKFSQYQFVDPTTPLEDSTYSYFIGDYVKIKDEYFNFEQSTRVTKYTFKQDSSGYGEEASYGNE